MGWDELEEANAALDLYEEAQRRAAKVQEEEVKRRLKQRRG